MRLAADFTGPTTISPPATSFSLGGFGFSSSHPLAIHTTPTNARGLSFHHSGLDIALPATTGAVLLKVICGADAVRVRGFDANNHAVATMVIASDGMVHESQLTGDRIARVTLDQGSNEGFLVAIVMDEDED